MAVNLKWLIRSPSQTHRCSFKIACGRVEVNRFHVRQIGRRWNGQHVPGLMRVVFAGNNRYIAHARSRKPAFAVGHQRQFTERHPVNHRNRQPAHARFVFHVQNRPVHVKSVRIRPVEDKHFAVKFGTGIHQPHHRGVIGVKTQPHILNIHHQHIEFADIFLTCTTEISVVQRKDRHTGFFIHRAGNVFAGIGRTSETVLR